MPSQANAKHSDTSHAQNRRLPHLYPSRKSQGSTYVTVPPPSALCLYPLQASWHPLHKMRVAHRSVGTQFLFLERLWNSVARLPVKGPHSHLSCESTFCPDHRIDAQQDRGCRCQSAVLLYRNSTWKTGKVYTPMYNDMHICTHAWTCTELSQWSQGSTECERSVSGSETYTFV